LKALILVELAVDVASSGGGSFEYPKWLQYTTWTLSASGAVTNAIYDNKIYRGRAPVRELGARSNFFNSLIDNPKYIKTAKYASTVGFAFDVVNIGLIITDGSVNGWTWKHSSDLMYGVIGIVPIIGDAISLSYTITDGKMSSDYNPNTPMVWENQMMGKF
jgi:hypothetical protein